MSGVGIDEASHRRPDWTEGEAIVLGNGQPWYFVRPVLEAFYPRRGEDGKTILAGGSQWYPDYERLIDALADSESDNDQMIALADLAIFLLGKNYDLTYDQAASLLPFKRNDAPDGEANAAMWRSVTDVAMGRAPKASPVG